MMRLSTTLYSVKDKGFLIELPCTSLHKSFMIMFEYNINVIKQLI